MPSKRNRQEQGGSSKKRRQPLPRFAAPLDVVHSSLSGEMFVLALKRLVKEHPPERFWEVANALEARFQRKGMGPELPRFVGLCKRISVANWRLIDFPAARAIQEIDRSPRTRVSPKFAPTEEQLLAIRKKREELFQQFWEFVRKNA